MIFQGPAGKKEKQKGFTLIEILIACAIVGIIGTGVTSAISQVFTMNARSVAHMTAIKEVENAVYWITPDAQMAQTVNTTTYDGFPLTLGWIDWNGNSYRVTYAIVNGQFERRYSVNGVQSVTTIVVDHVNASQTSCTVKASAFSFQITSTVSSEAGQESETRSFEVIPRCAPVTINATDALVVATTSLANGQVGIGYSQALSALGGTSPYTWAVDSGTLPSGLNLSPGGIISGTPSVAGTSSFIVLVSDSTGPIPAWVTKALLITINDPLAITTSSLDSGQANVAYNQTPAAAGGTSPYTWAISGTLPDGLSLNRSTGNILGTPTTAGTFSFIVQVSDSANPVPATVTKALLITINDSLTSTTSSLGHKQVSVACSQKVVTYSTMATGVVTFPFTVPATYTTTGPTNMANLYMPTTIFVIPQSLVETDKVEYIIFCDSTLKGNVKESLSTVLC